MKHLPAFLITPIILIITACSSLPSTENWPQDMPSRDYYETQYAADPQNQAAQTLQDYLVWNIRFYQGWALYSRGWFQLMDEVEAALSDEADKVLARNKMASIGQRVSAEWAKETEYRVIHTANVSTWGNSLIEAILQNDTLPYIYRVSADVDRLLDGSLHHSAITLDRYYRQDPDDAFH